MCIDTYTEYGCWHTEVVFANYRECSCSVVVGSRHFPDEICNKKCGGEGERKMNDDEKIKAVENMEEMEVEVRGCVLM